MGANDALSCRVLLGAPPALALGSAAGAEPKGARRAAPGTTLVAFFTRSGNTRVIAGTLQRDLGADLFEIAPATPYSADYEATVEQARLERDRGVEPALAGRVERIDGYRTIYLGFPIWGETAPPVIRSFLPAHDLEGRTLRPFITHGGYGQGDSLSVLKSHAPGARIGASFVLEADQERRTIKQVKGWLDGFKPS